MRSFQTSAALAFDTQKLTYSFENNPSKILVAVANPFVCNEELARTAFMDLIAVLQTPIGDKAVLSIDRAMIVAAQALFHYDLSGKDEIYAGFRDAFNSLKDKNVKLRYDPRKSKHERFSTDPAEAKDQLLEIIAEVAKVVCRLNHRYWHPLTLMVKELQSHAIVVLTHVDLMELLPSVQIDHFEPIFDELFGNRYEDRRVSQQILARHLSVDIKPARATDAILNQDMHHAAVRRLYHSIRAQLRARAKPLGTAPREALPVEKLIETAQEVVQGVKTTLAEWRTAAPAPTEVVQENDPLTVSDYVKEVGYAWAMTSPFAVLAAVLGAWCVSESFSLSTARWLNWSLVALGLLLLWCAVWCWFRLQFLRPKWRIEVFPDARRVVSVRTLLGANVQVATEEVTVRCSPLGHLLGVGWMVGNRNRIRSFRLPRLTRFLQGAVKQAQTTWVGDLPPAGDLRRADRVPRDPAGVAAESAHRVG